MTDSRRQRRLGVVLYYVSTFLGFAISIIYTPIMLKLLGKSEYGLYNLVSSVVGYLGVLSFGFNSAYLRYYYRFKGEKKENKTNELNGMFTIIYICIAIITLLIGGFLVQNNYRILGDKLTVEELAISKTLLILMVVNLAITFGTVVFDSFIVASERFIFQKMINLIKIVVNPLLITPLLLMGYGSIGLVAATTVITIFVSLINIYYCFKKLNMKISFSNFDRHLIKEMTIFSSFIFINLVIDQINWSVDRFIIGRSKGTGEVAIYGIGAQLNTYYVSLASIFSTIFTPLVNQLIAKGDYKNEISALFIKIGRLQYFILSTILLNFIFFGKSFINFWAGENYKGSYYVAVLLMVPVTIPLIQNLGIEIQRAMNKHQFRSYLYLVIAVANILISVLLVEKYGSIGAAFGTAVSLFVGNGIIMNLYYAKKIKLSISSFWYNILLISRAFVTPVLLAIFQLKFLPQQGIKNVLLNMFIFTLILFLNFWLISLNRYEKEMVSKPLKYIKKLVMK